LKGKRAVRLSLFLLTKSYQLVLRLWTNNLLIMRVRAKIAISMVTGKDIPLIGTKSQSPGSGSSHPVVITAKTSNKMVFLIVFFIVPSSRSH